MGGRVARDRTSSLLLCNELRDVSNYYPSPALQPSSNGSDNVLHNKSSKNSLETVSMRAKEVAMTCTSLPKKIKKKKRKRVGAAEYEGSCSNNGLGGKACHITVERNRRKQMNENLNILRSIMPCFYVKKGDQVSIIGGVVDYIVELQQILRSLEAKKHRKLFFDEVVPSPKITFPSPKPPLKLLTPKSSVSPVLTMPFSPATPQSQKPQMTSTSSLDPLVSKASLSTTYVKNELVAYAKSGIAAVEVKFLGFYLVLTTLSRNIRGQAAKIIATLEKLSLEVLHVSISMVDETTMLKYFTIKIGFDCQLSAEDVARRVLETFHK